MKSISFSILFVILLLATIPSNGSETNIVSNNNKSTIQSEKINGIDYVPLKLIASHIFPKSIFTESSSSIKYKDNEIKLALGSFYVLLRNNSDIRVAQMTLPAISLKNEIVVPFDTFIEALRNLDLIKYDRTESGFFIEIINNAHKIAEQASPVDNENLAPQNTNKSQIEKSEVKIDVSRSKQLKNNNIEAAKETQAKTIAEKTDVEEPKAKITEHSPDGIKSMPTAKPTTEVAPKPIIDYNIPLDFNSKIPANKYSIPSSLDRRSILKKNN